MVSTYTMMSRAFRGAHFSFSLIIYIGVILLASLPLSREGISPGSTDIPHLIFLFLFSFFFFASDWFNPIRQLLRLISEFHYASLGETALSKSNHLYRAAAPPWRRWRRPYIPSPNFLYVWMTTMACNHFTIIAWRVYKSRWNCATRKREAQNCASSLSGVFFSYSRIKFQE